MSQRDVDQLRHVMHSSPAEPSLSQRQAFPMDRTAQDTINQHGTKWPTAPPEPECSPRLSTSSTSDDSILRLVQKVSRTCSSRASSVLRRAGFRPDMRIFRYQESDGVSSTQYSATQACESSAGDLEPLLGPCAGVPASVRFSSYPSRTGTIRSRNMADVFQSCRNRLSMGSLRGPIEQILDRTEATTTGYLQLSSDLPPRLDVLSHLEPGAPGHESFRNSLEDALREITARGRSLDYISAMDLKRISRRIPAAMGETGKAASFFRGSEALKEDMTQSCEPLPTSQAYFEEADDLDQKCPAGESHLGETTRAKLEANPSLRWTAGARKDTMQCEPSKLSPSTAHLAAGNEISVETSQSHIITDTVKLIYPGFQERRGRVENFSTHEAALDTLEVTQLSDPVHDLAFYKADTRSYFLQPKCFLIDKDTEAVARSRGTVLVSLSRRLQALQGHSGAEELRPGEQDADKAYVSMSLNEDCVVVSIRRGHADDAPVFIEQVDET